ncbi:hypothetical protein VM1G_03555 [Cytospora mali]|uniref:Uncharacterized protein n=1 Tax=Cytospora mali TaxID=578113 RepID=A0A194VUT6_CYTMA|nr:hypothetical protein VM1G_03555 [Valsa mali]
MLDEDPRYVVSGVDMTDLYPAPFPDGIATVGLGRKLLSKLLASDQQEAERIFRFAQNPGFFNVDLTDHEDGIIQNIIDRSEKYWTKAVLPSGEVKYNEMMNFPLTDMFGYSVRNDFALPAWLDDADRGLIERTGRQAHHLAHVVLSGLGQSIEIKTGALCAAHRIEDQSGDFLRLLHYPGCNPSHNADHLRFPAHTDVTSIGLLFTWRSAASGTRCYSSCARRIFPRSRGAGYGLCPEWPSSIWEMPSRRDSIVLSARLRLKIRMNATAFCVR